MAREQVTNLVIIGNGFDLACNIETSFSNFISSKYNELKNEFKTAYIDFLNFSKNSRIHSNTEENMIKEFEERFLKLNGTENFWMILLLLNMQIHAIPNWCDIEAVIRDFLLNNSEINIQKLIFYITKEQKENNQNFTIGYSSESSLNFLEICALILLKENQKIDQFMKSPYRYLMCQLKDFESNFRLYLNEVVKAKATEYNLKSGKLFDLIVQDDFSAVNNEVENIVDFNYTMPAVFDNPTQIGGVMTKIARVDHVHGDLKDNNLILGIDSSNISVDDEKYKFTKTYRELSLHINRTKNRLLPNTVKRINIFGHSLDEQDYSYFQAIFDRYDLYSSEVVIEFDYSIYNLDLKSQIKGQVYQGIIDLIQKYADTLTNVAHGKNLLHKLLLEERLIMREIDINDL
ncbi:AbiH family protein [Pediococcus ethanolidurans]|uniref:Bacteriophage abortive infection AbiH n=1 Tax=Pediococcus ethanolidurans TaxID=319653 RepID=A0A0R2K1Y9_9LACO|nr:AbiH family protein [Pediococcus ethanolidurans]KRN83615.1 hypothetical protein IV87_GL000084 [Pediococcus ethanolidurans]GEN94030.1 hypothetical protein PET01_00800 [Pediococcus ethanolidurans]SER02533.1 Bacteriophage abortive infection AbiH [Pediococcus ethanolidurans]